MNWKLTLNYFLMGLLTAGAADCSGGEPTVESTAVSQQAAMPSRDGLGTPAATRAIRARLQNKHLTEAILGSLLYLDDNQIRIRPGQKNCNIDSCDGDGCFSTVEINPPFGLEQAIDWWCPFPQMRNLVGEWSSYVHGLPKKLGKNGKAVLTVQDSNMFMTAAIAYPMYLFDETALANSDRVLTQMRKLAMLNVHSYKRGDAFNFWREQRQSSGRMSVSPYNIPTGLVDLLIKSYVGPVTRQLWQLALYDQNVPPLWWFDALANSDINPTGAEAAFNVPNDADDTSVATVMQVLHKRDFDPTSADSYYANAHNFDVDMAAFARLEKFRDLNRTQEDGRDHWKKDNSGAYLTWLKDESQPTFGSPKSGIIPLGVNNVDCVVNANALLAKSLLGQTGDSGFESAVQTLAVAIEKKAWPCCGLYYPQNMVLPYTASRAYRDGQIHHPVLEKAMQKLLRDLLEMQNSDGSFPGGEDQTSDLSTALALNALLNIGTPNAKAIGRVAGYEFAIEAAVQFLLDQQQSYALKNDDTMNRTHQNTGLFDSGRRWEDGLFFAASFWDFAHWRSEPYTVSIVLEALSKYLLAYETGDVSITQGRKIRIQTYTRTPESATEDLVFDVR